MLQQRRLCSWCDNELSPRARRDAVFCSRRCRQAAFRSRCRHDDVTTSSVRTRRACKWCDQALPKNCEPNTVYCSARCRQAAYRSRRRQETRLRYAKPMVMAYADPPYPGFAALYKDEPEYSGEIDHAQLIADLSATYDGWALSTSADSLRHLLPLCPPEAKICPWVKPIGVSSRTRGMHNTWEPLIVVPGRHLRPGFRDWLLAQPARLGGTLLGRKPIAFVVWLIQCLGLCEQDSLVDLFPGTGIVTRVWREVSKRRLRP